VNNDPFGLPTSQYGWEEEDEETQSLRRMRENFEKEVDEDMELIDDLKERAGDDYASTEEDSPSAQLPRGGGNRKRAKRQYDLVNQVLNQVKLLINEQDQIYVYQEGGYYQHIPRFDTYLAALLPEETLAELDVRDISDIVKRISWVKSSHCDLDGFNYQDELVNLENSVFNIETGELIEHSPSFRFSYVVHANYLSDKGDISCPEFERFFQTSLDGDPKKRQLLLESIGYICTDTNAGKCAFFFKGQPNSGKSVIVAFISKLFDPELVVNIPLHQLGDRFLRAELSGKKVNVSGELAGRALKDISIFKSVTGGDHIMGEFKGKDPFYFSPRCKLLFAGNTLPHTTETDTTAAFVNRIKLLLFNTSINSEDQDKGLLDKLWAERNSIVTLALDAVRGIAKCNYVFTCPEDSEEFLKSFELRGNVINAFVEDCCELSSKARVFNRELYPAFEEYCAKNGLERLSRQKFYDLLSGIPNVLMKRIRMNGENRRGHIGIGLKKASNDGTLEQ